MSLDYKNIKKKIIIFIEKYIKNSGFKGVTIGLSGGIDSSVVARLSVEALGKEKVFALILPCQSQKKDTNDAIYLSKYLKINYKIINLTEIYEYFIKNLNYKIKNKNFNSIFNNIKSRLRMTTLYAEASKNNCLVIGTTNKSELITGHYTKYGDGGVDFEPIGDLLKTEIIELAKYLFLPSFLINNVPKAGFIKGLTDEKEFGFSYQKLDKYIKSGNGDKKIVKKIEKIYKKNKHKRIMPKIFNLNRKFFLK